jgi:2-haloacid dehalogenase
MDEPVTANDQAPALNGIRACVFDAYGTLFNVDSACLRLRDRLGGATTALAALWRDKQLQYTWLRTVQGRHADFAQVTRDALDHALQALDLDPALASPLMQAFDALDVFPEVVPVLQQLRSRGFATAILSNGTPGMLAALLAHAGIGGLFDAVYSVEPAGAFKPHARVYRIPGEQLDLRPEQICFVSSNAWDAHGASAFGMRVAWCNRRAQAPDRLPGAPDACMRTLAELPGLLADPTGVC